MAEEIVTIIYDTVIKKHFHNILQLETDGNMWYICQYSQENARVRDLGAYEGTYDSRSGNPNDPLEIINSNNIFELEEVSISNQLPPVKTIVINKGNRTKSFKTGIDSFMPNVLNDLEQSLINLIDKIWACPFATLGIKMNIRQSIFIPGETVDIHFMFFNSGTTKASFMNPKIDVEDFGGLLTIDFWSKTKSENDVIDEDLSLTIDCTEFEFQTGPFDSIPSDRLLLELQPDESLAFSIKFPFPKCPPGLYVAEGIYKSFQTKNINAQNQIIGEYHSDGVSLKIELK